MKVWIGTFCYELCSDDTAIVVDYDKNCVNSQIIVQKEVKHENKKYIVTGIGEMAFAYVTTNKVLLPSSILNIGKRAFYQCSLRTIRRGATQAKCLQIGERAFFKCYNLETASFGSEYVLNGDRTFAECRMLKNINSQNLIRCLPTETFKDCISLKEFHFSDGLQIESLAFRGVHLQTVHIQTLSDYDQDLLDALKNAEIHCENNSNLTELAYEGYNILIP